MGYPATGLRMADVHGNRAGPNTTESANQGTAAAAIDAGIDPAAVGAAGAAPQSGSAVGAIIAVLVVLIALRFFATRAGEGAQYETLPPTFFNVMTITLAAILGLNFTKFLAGRFLKENNALRTLIVAA